MCQISGGGVANNCPPECPSSPDKTTATVPNEGTLKRELHFRSLKCLHLTPKVAHFRGVNGEWMFPKMAWNYKNHFSKLNECKQIFLKVLKYGLSSPFPWPDFFAIRLNFRGDIICRRQPYIQVAPLQYILSNYYIIWISSKKHIRPYQIITTTAFWQCVVYVCLLVCLTQNRHLWQFEVRWRPNLLGDAFMWRATSSWVSVGHEFREFRFAALAADRAQGGWRRSVEIFPVKRILFRPIIMEVENDCIWKVTTIWRYTQFSLDHGVWEEGYKKLSTFGIFGCPAANHPP